MLGGFLAGNLALDLGYANGLGDAEELQNGDLDPGDIQLIPGQAVAGRRGMRMVIVVPAFAKGEQRHPPAIAGIVACGEAAPAPEVSSGVDQPGGMQADHHAHADSPEKQGGSAERARGSRRARPSVPSDSY